MGRDAFFAIRASRALPPGGALQGEGRSRVYSAALEQFDQLMTGARAVGTATRPLLLFYALSQAGRAITAAHAVDRWRLQGHGLSAPMLANPELLKIEIKANPSPGGAKHHADAPIDSFRGVAHATGSPTFERPVAIGELWSSLPEVHDLPPQTLGQWPRALPVLQLDDLNQKFVMWDRVSVAIANVPWPSPETLEQQLAHYPAAGDLVVDRLQPGLPEMYVPTTVGDALKCHWPSDEPDVAGHAKTIGARTSTGLFDRDGRWLRPAVGGQAASPLVTWWALLFGLSMIARYEPAGWRWALDYDLSELAAPLDELLEFALDAIPELVLRALRLETSSTE
jgi:hypothetical protein